MGKFRLSGKERGRLAVLKKIEAGRLSRREGAELLGLSYRQMLRVASWQALEGNADARRQKLALARKKIFVSELLDGSLRLTHQGRELTWKELSVRPPRPDRQLAPPTKAKPRYKPPANHPWRRQRPTP